MRLSWSEYRLNADTAATVLAFGRIPLTRYLLREGCCLWTRRHGRIVRAAVLGYDRWWGLIQWKRLGQTPRARMLGIGSGVSGLRLGPGGRLPRRGDAVDYIHLSVGAGAQTDARVAVVI